MFRLESDTALLESFRPKDRQAVELPPGLTFPTFVRHYLAWPHPAGGRVFLVFSTQGGVPTGITFETNGSAGAPVAMCDWCHQSAAGTGVGLLTARVTGTKTAGVHVCTDLSCKQKVEDECDRAGRSAVPELNALVERIGRFASEVLGIDLSGANR
ncbi:MAG: FBP domain-containing protein [Myxococcota bacterium]